MLPLRMALDSAASSCSSAQVHLSLPYSLIVRYFSGWDIHDTVYSKELLISNKANGYRDLIAHIDLSTYRRIPWENDVPFFLVSFLDPVTKEPLVVDPRGILKITADRAAAVGRECFAGVEYEVRASIYLVSL